jgi:uncharacterized protein YbaP (TraB family)
VFHQIIVILNLTAALLNNLLRPLQRCALRRLLLPLGLGALLAATGAAGASCTDTIGNAAQAAGRQGGALFRIDRDGRSAYVFSTIHVGRADFYPLDDRVLQALQQASCVALEIDPNNTQALAPWMARYGVYADGKSWQQELPAGLQKNLNALLEKYGMTPASVANLKPWLLATVLGISAYASQGYQPQFGVDTALANFAKSSNKRLIELETPEQQLALLGGLSAAEQIQFLQDSVDEIRDPLKAQRALQLLTLWRNGDIDGLAAMLAEMTGEQTFSSRFVQRALLDGRNPGLADRIDKLSNASPHAFVGIGMLHLVGPNSVLTLLQRRGYAVQRVY